MRAKEFLSSDLKKEQIKDFIDFVSSELELDSLPKIKFISKPVENEHSNSFACFNVGTKEISLYTKGRHILDVLRSLSHEMVHFKQLLEKGDNLDGSTGSDDENEANALAGQIMRKYGKLHPELF